MMGGASPNFENAIISTKEDLGVWSLIKMGFLWMSLSNRSSKINDSSKHLAIESLVGGLEHLDYFSTYWECHHPNWRTHIFQRDRYTTNQLVIGFLCQQSMSSKWPEDVHPKAGGEQEMTQWLFIWPVQVPAETLKSRCFFQNPCWLMIVWVYGLYYPVNWGYDNPREESP